MEGKVAVSVTAKDIEKARRLLKSGKRMRSRNCPVALALRRTLGVPVSVSLDEFGPLKTREFVNYRLPRTAVNFIYSFDDGREVKPFKFSFVNKMTGK